jgi:hypothetical protein
MAGPAFQCWPGHRPADGQPAVVTGDNRPISKPSVMRAASIRADVRRADHFRPARKFLADQGRVAGGVKDPGAHADRGRAFPRLGLASAAAISRSQRLATSGRIPAAAGTPNQFVEVAAGKPAGMTLRTVAPVLMRWKRGRRTVTQQRAQLHRP